MPCPHISEVFEGHYLLRISKLDKGRLFLVTCVRLNFENMYEKINLKMSMNLILYEVAINMYVFNIGTLELYLF